MQKKTNIAHIVTAQDNMKMESVFLRFIQSCHVRLKNKTKQNCRLCVDHQRGNRQEVAATGSGGTTRTAPLETPGITAQHAHGHNQQSSSLLLHNWWKIVLLSYAGMSANCFNLIFRRWLWNQNRPFYCLTVLYTKSQGLILSRIPFIIFFRQHSAVIPLMTWGKFLPLPLLKLSSLSNWDITENWKSAPCDITKSKWCCSRFSDYILTQDCFSFTGDGKPTKNQR